MRRTKGRPDGYRQRGWDAINGRSERRQQDLRDSAQGLPRGLWQARERGEGPGALRRLHKDQFSEVSCRGGALLKATRPVDATELVRQLLLDSDDRTSSDKDLKTTWIEHARNLERADPIAWARVQRIAKDYKGEHIANRIEILCAYALRKGYRPPEAYFEISKRGTIDKFVPGELVRDLLENERFIVIGDEGERSPLWYAQNGYYHAKGEMYVRQKIEEALGPLARLVNRNQRLEVVDQVRNASILWQRDIIDNTDEIPVRNGVLDWKTRTLRPYDLTKDRFFMQLPVMFDPKADCPRVKEFLDEIVPSDTKQALLDVTAQALLRVPMKDHLAAVGPPDSGKTTFAALVGVFLGEENVSAIPLQSLVHDRFAPSGLKNKLLNIYDDLGTRRLADVAAFNAQTGGGKIRHERKHCDATEFTPFAKHIFLANKMPPLDSSLSELGDDVAAFFRRLHVEHFPFIFRDDPEPGTNHRRKEDRERLLREITSADEMNGFLNMLLDALPHVVNHGPRWSKSSRDSMIAYFRSSNSFQAFLSELCSPSPKKMISRDALRECYQWYSDERGLELVKDRAIHDRLINYGATAYQDPPNAQPRRRWWRGVEIDLQKVDEAGNGDVSAKVRAGMKDVPRDEITASVPQITSDFQARLNLPASSITTITASSDIRVLEKEDSTRTIAAVKENAVIPVIACDSKKAAGPDHLDLLQKQMFNEKVHSLQECACPGKEKHLVDMLEESVRFLAKTKKEGDRAGPWQLREHLSSEFPVHFNDAVALVDQHFSEIDDLAVILRQIKDPGGWP